MFPFQEVYFSFIRNTIRSNCTSNVVSLNRITHYSANLLNMFQGLYSIHCAVTFCSRISNPYCNVTTNDALQNLDLCSAFAALSLYCATPDLPWDLGFAVLAERPTASFASYNKQRVTTGQILTRIPAKQKSPLINFCYFNSA